MSNSWKTIIIQNAYKHWENSDGHRAIQILVRHIPVLKRAEWSASILETIVSRFGPVPPIIGALAELARNHDKWGEDQALFIPRAKNLVYSVRKTPPIVDDMELNRELISLAYNVGKTICNARYPETKFDQDSTWLIGHHAEQISKKVMDPEFKKQIWSTISNIEYLTLETPN